MSAPTRFYWVLVKILMSKAVGPELSVLNYSSLNCCWVLFLKKKKNLAPSRHTSNNNNDVKHALHFQALLFV